jgi:N-acetylneuraminic acid mutarotase
LNQTLRHAIGVAKESEMKITVGIFDWKPEKPLRRWRGSSLVGDGVIRRAFRHLSVAIMATVLVATASLSYAQSNWAFSTPMPKAMGEIVGVTIGHGMFVFAGLDDERFVPYGAVYRYDADSEKWTTLQNMPLPAHHIMATAYGGKVYVFGGFTRPPDLKSWQPTSAAWQYDPATDTWKALAPLPRPRGAGQAVTVGDKIYVVGGACSDPEGKTSSPIVPKGPGQTVVGFVDEYDPATNTWKRKADMPTPRNHFLAAESGGKIYAIDGRIGAVFVTMAGITDVVEEYDPATDRWKLVSRAPTNRGDVSGAVLNGKIYVAGGEFQDSNRKMAFWAVEAYNPATNTWEVLPHMQITRHGFAMAFVDNKLHAVGGSFQSDGMPGIFSETATHEVLTVEQKK